MRRLVVGALTAAALLSVVVATASTRGDRDEQRLERALDALIAAGMPGALVRVHDGEKTVELARGQATRGIRFRVGSVTKTFVGALTLELVDRGVVRLDDSVDEHLPGLLRDGEDVTIRALLTHRAGLFDFTSDPVLLRDDLPPLALVRIADGRERLPGYAYSSTNYLVLGLIMEEAGGGSLGSQLRERLFSPLGLRRTSFVPGAIRGLHVHGHRPPSHQGVVTGPPIDTSAEPAWWTWAAGAIVSSAGDLHRFFAALLRGRVLSTPLLREMETLVPAGRLQYGLGIATFPTPCVQAWGHTGNVQGTIAVAWNTKDASRQVVLVVNTYPLSAELEAAVRHLQDAAFCPAA
jgi:D-alanyl-D-alanine carboxypeptidase